METVIVPGIAGGMAMKKAVPIAFGLDPPMERTTACGQMWRQQSCWQPMREASSGIWQSKPMCHMAMGQWGAQGRLDIVPMPQVSPARAG
ncbi:MAG: hypothetical protein ACLPY1_02400 [Terracidiphilus sp.]